MIKIKNKIWSSEKNWIFQLWKLVKRPISPSTSLLYTKNRSISLYCFFFLFTKFMSPAERMCARADYFSFIEKFSCESDYSIIRIQKIVLFPLIFEGYSKRFEIGHSTNNEIDDQRFVLKWFMLRQIQWYIFWKYLIIKFVVVVFSEEFIGLPIKFIVRKNRLPQFISVGWAVLVID